MSQTELSLTPWPQSPPARNEQRILPIPGTIQEQYEVWRLTPDGQEVLQMAERLALQQAASGATRISISWIWEAIRKTRKQSADNSMRALVARYLVETHPHLAALIELRVRKAP